MAGAHWMSDIMVGGLGTALTTLAFGLLCLNYYIQHKNPATHAQTTSQRLTKQNQ
jgi:membrane-associated phospholipid phosphatase